PSGNQWGMPLRMVLDSGAVRIEDAVLIGARNLDPPEVAFIAEVGLATALDGVEDALADTDAVYVAFDCDGLDPGELACFMPQPNGLTLTEAHELLRAVSAHEAVAGVGLTGAVPESDVDELSKLVSALGL